MDDLSERLFAHFVGGRWRVPFGTGRIAVTRADGLRAGSVVLAEAQDFARAQSALRGADDAARARLAARLAPYGMRDAILSAQPAPAPLILCGGAADGHALGAALGGGLGHGLIWCPPPDAALPATEIARQVQEADLPPGCFALLHAFTPQTAPLIRATGLARARSD
jgi:acyl-CoA reductase-like NAD-dependent aldehyde dehydrogenase